MSVHAISAPATTSVRTDRGVALWLYLIAAMIGLMVVVGGLTRLTGSGLSMILFGYVFWTALEVIGATQTRIAPAARFQIWAGLLVLLIFVQILLGAFMAGLDAGLAFSTWPTYAGAWIPQGLYDLTPWWT